MQTFFRQVDRDSGIITTKQPIDYEIFRGTVTFNVTATDSSGAAVDEIVCTK